MGHRHRGPDALHLSLLRARVLGGLLMTLYRCVVQHPRGAFVPYAGVSFESASDAMRQWEGVTTVVVERLMGPEWRCVMGVYRA